MNVSGGLRETWATKAAGFSDLMGTAEAVPPSKLLLKPVLGDRRPWRHSVFILRNRILQASLLAAAILWLTGCSPRASIAEINTVRKHLSRIKGGRLAERARLARLVTVAISDVPGDDPAVIGSGPTVPSGQTRTR